jgi:hypothetical protein
MKRNKKNYQIKDQFDQATYLRNKYKKTLIKKQHQFPKLWVGDCNDSKPEHLIVIHIMDCGQCVCVCDRYEDSFLADMYFQTEVRRRCAETKEAYFDMVKKEK